MTRAATRQSVSHAGRPDADIVILTQGLTKIFKDFWMRPRVRAVDSLDLEVRRGEIYGLLGPNGSGKSTTIKILLGLLHKTSGRVTVLGKNPSDVAVKDHIGVLPEESYLYPFLNAYETLDFYAKLFELDRSVRKRRIEELLDMVGLSATAHRQIKEYSKGMQRRIGLAQALINDPELLILDEPTTGLDPIARKEIRDILVRLRDEGKTLLISSHELLEVELISDRVGILYQGVLQTCGALEDLLVERDLLIDVRTPPESALEGIRAAGIELEDTVQEVARLRVPGSATLYDALERCKAQNLEVVSVSPRRETLEELFVRVVGQAGGESEAEMTSVATETADNEESS
jgi:ABC-2 type transport system ATP-binding protein